MANSFFPFNTCEKPDTNNLIAQPVSASINLLSCIILLFLLCKAKTLIIKLLILTFIAFQLFHAFSHSKHIDGDIQTYIIHAIWYLVSFMILFANKILIKKNISNNTILLLFFIIIVDLYILFNTDKSLIAFTAFSIPTIIILSYYNNYKKNIKRNIHIIFILLIILSILLLNEKFNCNAMMAYYVFPYHIFVEIMGLLLFTMLAYTFLLLE